jgi:predicted PurR-regulated permease PerM
MRRSDATGGTGLSDSIQSRGSAVISFAAVIVIVYGLQMAKVVLVPFLIAAFLALITVRPMLWMQRHRVPAILGALIIVCAMMLVLFLVGAIVGTSVAEFTAALPSYQQRLDVIVQGILKFVAETLNSDESLQSLSDMIDPGWAMGLAASILNGLGRSAHSLEAPRVFLSNLGRYLGIKTLVSMATGMTAGVLTWAIGLDFPLLWAMLAFLLNYVPTIGSIIAAVGDGDRHWFCGYQRVIRQFHRAAADGLRRRHLAARGLHRPRAVGLGFRAGRHVAVRTVDNDAQARAGK